MATPRRLWTLLALPYLAFFAWYTSFGGPLTPSEIDRYLGVLAERGADPERMAIWKQFMQSDSGDDFVMLNAIEMRETPLAVAGAPPDASSAEVLRLYTDPFLGKAFRSAAHPVFLGWAAAGAIDLWGIEGAEQWSTGGLVRYRSRRDLMEQAVYASGLDIHDFKTAAMEKTIAFPLDPFFQLGDPRFVLALLLLVLGLSAHLRIALKRASALELARG